MSSEGSAATSQPIILEIGIYDCVVQIANESMINIPTNKIYPRESDCVIMEMPR